MESTEVDYNYYVIRRQQKHGVTLSNVCLMTDESIHVTVWGVGSFDKICFYFAYFVTNFLLREKNNFIEELPLEALNFYHFA